MQKSLWKILRTFARSPKGVQLNFLLNYESTRYKLADHSVDLTFFQIYFLYLCAKDQQDKLDQVMKKSGSYSDQYSPLSITDEDSPEEVKDKLNCIREYYACR